MTPQKTVLIVDDEPDMLFLYEGMAKIKNYKITTADSIESAEEHLNKKYDLAILDGLNGDCFKLYEKINADRKIILTCDETIVEKSKIKKIEAYSKLEVNLKDIFK